MASKLAPPTARDKARELDRAPIRNEAMAKEYEELLDADTSGKVYE